MTVLQFITKFIADLEKQIADQEAALNRRVLSIQARLFEEAIKPYMDTIDRENGQLSNSVANLRRANKIEAIFNDFQRSNIDSELIKFANELLSVGSLSQDYYTGIGFDSTAIKLNAALDQLRAIIGVNAENELVSGGYLFRLGKTDAVRGEVRQYVVNSITSRLGYQDFKTGFSDLIKGTKDVDGALVRYWRQYAYDTYNQANEIVSGHIAEDLGLDYFIYQGSVILTTRKFCKERAGKVFSRSEALQWKDDPDLIDKKTKSTYNPFIERGRYNCRHFLTWITKETAKTLRSDL